jgi:predicted porin
MNKKIAAVAVAGLFAAPAVALAQSSVTISGVLKMGMENLKISNYSTNGTANTSVTSAGRGISSGNNSQYGVVDDSSRIIFNIREDLGGGLSAIGQLDMRVKPDDQQGAASTAATPTTGNSHVGLESKSWGRVFFGRQDLHYFNTSGNISGKNSLRADSISLLAFAGAIGRSGTPVNGGTAIAGATRTQNVLHYTTPNWGGFTGIIAYSSNPIASEGDIGNAGSQSIRKGNAWNLNPNYAAANWQVGYSYWRSKPDAGMPANVGALATTAAGLNGIATNFGAADQKSNRIYGDYTFGFGLKVGLAWDNSKLTCNTGTGPFSCQGTTLSKRTVWSIPLQYSFMGKHQITGHYTWAKDDTANVLNNFGGNNNTGAHMWAIGYSYDLSKRTSVGLTYAKITNQSNAGYNLFTSASLGLGTAGIMAGEDPRMFGTTLRHAF